MNEYYYRDQNGKLVGPLSIQLIRAKISSGQLPRDVQLCEAGQEEWFTIDEVSRRDIIAKARTPYVFPSVSSDDETIKSKWAPFLRKFGYAGMILSGVFFLAGIILLFTSSSFLFALGPIQASLGLLLLGVCLCGFSEVLTLLAKIASK